jgi:putative transposase
VAKGKREERPVLYRAVKFELRVTSEQEKLLLRLSDGLREIWNWALELRVHAYEEYKKQKQDGVPKADLLRLPTLFDQINLLTSLRQEDTLQQLAHANTPRNWQEETLDTLDGAFKSFFALAKNGDKDARPPWQRKQESFCEIPGRSGFSVKGSLLVFAPNIFGKETLSFKVPDYCQALLQKGERLKKFTLFRDESLLAKPGRYWVSLVYEITRPDPLAMTSGTTVYLSLGATWIGVLAPNREQIVKLWRSDKLWKRSIDELDTRLEIKKNAKPEEALKKGSRVWRKRTVARRRMFELMSRQQKQNQREVVAKLLTMGAHFVVQDLTIRGGLADSSKPERGGALGLNWSVQNTGSIGRLLQYLKEKAQERGGYVLEHKPDLPPSPGMGSENKLPMAKRLRDDFLVSHPQQ